MGGANTFIIFVVWLVVSLALALISETISRAGED